MKRATPINAGGLRVLVNVPLFWKMIVDMVRAGSGYGFDHEILAPGTDLRSRASVTDLVEVAMLPKVIGGDAFTVDEDGKEDETCTRGCGQPSLSQFLKGLA